MARGPLFQDGYKPQFSGHETFLAPLWMAEERYSTASLKPRTSPITGSRLLGRWGYCTLRRWQKHGGLHAPLGKNASGIIEEPTGTNAVRPTELGRMLFGPDGLDPYMEHPSQRSG